LCHPVSNVAVSRAHCLRSPVLTTANPFPSPLRAARDRALRNRLTLELRAVRDRPPTLLRGMPRTAALPPAASRKPPATAARQAQAQAALRRPLDAAAALQARAQAALARRPPVRVAPARRVLRVLPVPGQRAAMPVRCCVSVQLRNVRTARYRAYPVRVLARACRSTPAHVRRRTSVQIRTSTRVTCLRATVARTCEASRQPPRSKPEPSDAFEGCRCAANYPRFFHRQRRTADAIIMVDLGYSEHYARSN